MHTYEVRPRKDKQGVDLISDLMHGLHTSTAPTLILLTSLIVASALCAEQSYKLDELKTANGHEYHRVTITERNADGITIRHASGMARLWWNEIPAETQRLLGYDAAAEAVAKAAQTARFEVELKDIPGSIDDARAGGSFVDCNIVFDGTPPVPKAVDKIVRDSLQSVALSHPTRDILAMAFRGDETLEDNEYSGALVYKAAERRIMTLDESRGVKSTGFDLGAYYITVREDKTVAGIKPERKWLSLSLIFPSTPSVQRATEAAIGEIGTRLAQGLDINVSVMVGDKNVKTSWKQMPDPAGGFLDFRYTVANRTIYNKSTLIKKLP
jgi:hypothetical protein